MKKGLNCCHRGTNANIFALNSFETLLLTTLFSIKAKSGFKTYYLVDLVVYGHNAKTDRCKLVENARTVRKHAM